MKKEDVIANMSTLIDKARVDKLLTELPQLDNTVLATVEIGKDTKISFIVKGKDIKFATVDDMNNYLEWSTYNSLIPIPEGYVEVLNYIANQLRNIEDWKIVFNIMGKHLITSLKDFTIEGVSDSAATIQIQTLIKKGNATLDGNLVIANTIKSCI